MSLASIGLGFWGALVIWIIGDVVATIGVGVTTRVTNKVMTKMVGFNTRIGMGIYPCIAIGGARVTQADGMKEGLGKMIVWLLVGPQTSSPRLSSTPCASQSRSKGSVSRGSSLGQDLVSLVSGRLTSSAIVIAVVFG